MQMHPDEEALLGALAERVEAELSPSSEKAVLYSTFLQYANFGQNRSRQVRELDSFRFAKLVREACDANSSPEPLALSQKQQQEIDLLFTALLVKAGAARTLNYHAFEALAVPAIAEAAASTEDAVRFSLSCAVPALRSSVPVSPRARLRSAGSSGSLSSPVRPASAGVVRSPMLSLAFGSDAPSPKPKAVSPESSPRRVSMEDLQKRGAFASPPRSVVGVGAEPTAAAVDAAASAALAAEAAPTATAPPDERLRLLFDAYAAFGRDRRIAAQEERCLQAFGPPRRGSHGVLLREARQRLARVGVQLFDLGRSFLRRHASAGAFWTRFIPAVNSQHVHFSLT